ncbi:flagellar M-ring family protein, partial [Vibrio parahaemolyticus V-223/04]
AQTSQFLN